MQRSMSYRKPAPIYVPSPPPSPHQSTFPVSAQTNFDLEVPPLPPNWREVFNQVGMLPQRPIVKSTQLPTDTEEDIEMDTTECPKGRTLTTPFLGPSIARSVSNVPCSQKHRLHQQYRPPTPPIPSQHKSRQSLLNPDNLISDDANSEATLAHHVHRTDHLGLYPRDGPGAPSLKISSSFKTVGSFNTSVGWSQGMTTGGFSNCPSLLLNHQHDRDLPKITGDMSESVNTSCWKGLGAWATKVRNLIIICK